MLNPVSFRGKLSNSRKKNNCLKTNYFWMSGQNNKKTSSKRFQEMIHCLLQKSNCFCSLKSPLFRIFGQLRMSHPSRSFFVLYLNLLKVAQWGAFTCQILPPGVNFTNILWAAFAPKSFRQKITNPNCKHIKGVQRIWFEKSACKILVKLAVMPKFFAQLLSAYNLAL